MRRLTLVVVLALLLAACGDVPLRSATHAQLAVATRPARAHGTVLFSDSFNGSTLDASKWNPSWFGSGNNPSKPVNGSDQSCYDPAQVNVGAGQLTLTATKRPCLGYQWASGLINTNGHFAFTTGTFKAKVCLPGSGPIDDWPAIWSDGQHWPNDGEIDLLEGLGGNGQWHVHSSQPTVGGGSLNAGCHKLRYVRTPSKTTFFYDGANQGSTSTSSFAGSPHYLILELAVSNSISPPIVAAQLHVDWVQVTS